MAVGIELVVLGFAVIILLIIVFLLLKSNVSLGKQLKELKFSKQSQSVKYGKITEQFFPLMEEYPFEPSDFRFLGSPIDGIQFNEDEVVFVEFKAGNSKLNEKQRKIKRLVEDGKVKWEEFNFKE